MTFTFPKSRRIKHSRTFTLVLRSGACAADGVLVLFAVRQQAIGPSRLGVTIPKRTGNAVTRNRWKRLIRESFRTQQHRLPAGFDFVIRPKKGATLDWLAIERSVPFLSAKAARKLRS